MRSSFFFFFNDTATTEIYTLSLHDALPIWRALPGGLRCAERAGARAARAHAGQRSEEHTSELQSHSDLVCRLLLEKKKKYTIRGRSIASKSRASRLHYLYIVCEPPIEIVAS